MKIKWAISLSLAVFGIIQIAQAQTLDSYLADMREALLPYATIAAPNCHRVEIDISGPWADYAIPAGISEQNGELKWLIMAVDVHRLFLDLADLDEDKLTNQRVFSLGYLTKHQKGTRYVPDTAAIFLETHGLNTNMTVHAVDLDKVHALEGRRDITESDMGVYIDQRRLVILTFSDQEHADVFYKAVQKATVICKAQ